MTAESLADRWPEEPTKPVYISRTITVRDDQDDAINAICDRENRTYSALLREFIAIGLDAWGEH